LTYQIKDHKPEARLYANRAKVLRKMG